MIKNERQVKMSKSKLSQFKAHLKKIEKDRKKIDKKSYEYEKSALENQINELENSIFEYERLWNSGRSIETVGKISDIPSILIRARISQGMSQKEFAERMGVKEQQIQRYEATNYESASLSRIRDFVESFDIPLQDEYAFHTPLLTIEEFISRIRKAGIEKEFIINRLLSPKAKSLLENKKLDRPDSLIIEIYDHISNIFGWTYNQVVSNENLAVNPMILGDIKFKVPKNASKNKVGTYTLYSNYLGQLLKKGIEHQAISKLPNDPFEVRRGIIDKFGSINIENSLRYIWDLGVPVLALNDPGGFHGLYMNEEGRIVIVINHLTKSPATWLFSLFHEFWHAVNAQEEMRKGIIEIEDLSIISESENIDVKEELTASMFAGAILLGRPVDPIVNKCIDRAEGLIPRYKNVVIEVAKEENVPVDVLANCVAFKASLYGGNFWGAAHNLQQEEKDIPRIARNVLLSYVDFSHISGFDLDLLRRSLISLN